ncbi:hypothetical protein QYE76_047546 [Lolium multiflorum]|uniref:TF-B3 domain-containing protein n=1 Tax=Lolium multiflorum TaxID=4521 RepID=A0AAD8TRR8_LOLMU|nr:hypothetical protein QYE76_047546 [Lolium multiflorum]
MKKEVTESTEVQFLGERMASSPELQFLGERVFNNVCSNMSKLSDDLYNAGLTLGSASVSTGKENIPPKRLINRSNYLCSPYDVKSTSKFVPNVHEMQIYETITTLCDDPMYRENDCSVFIVKYMEWYCSRNPKSCAFSAQDIPDFRVQIALDTVYNEYNSETEQMDFLSTFDLETVPCFVRRQFNDLVGNIFFVATSDEVQYKFHVKKGSSKTRVFGSGYQKFLHDYDLKVGDYIMFDFDNAPELFGIFAEGPDGIEKHRVEEIPTAVVHTQGVTLTTAQTLKKDQLLRERGLGLGVVFVHTLTNTDLRGNGLLERGIDLVYGGGSIGLMGLVSHAVYDGGRHVIGYPKPGSQSQRRSSAAPKMAAFELLGVWAPLHASFSFSIHSRKFQYEVGAEIQEVMLSYEVEFNFVDKNTENVAAYNTILLEFAADTRQILLFKIDKYYKPSRTTQGLSDDVRRDLSQARRLKLGGIFLIGLDNAEGWENDKGKESGYADKPPFKPLPPKEGNEEKEEEEEKGTKKKKKKENKERGTAYPSVNEITLGNRKYVAPNDYCDNESEYDDLPMPFTYISNHDLNEHTTFDIANLWEINSENDDDNNCHSVSAIHASSHNDIESSKLGEEVFENPLATGHYVLDTSPSNNNDGVDTDKPCER